MQGRPPNFRAGAARALPALSGVARAALRRCSWQLRRSAVARAPHDAAEPARYDIAAAFTRASASRAVRCHTFAVALGVLACCSIVPVTAAAFCRQSLSTEPNGPCDEAPGVPFLFWQRPCVTYALHDELFAYIPQLTEAQVRAALRAAFQTWADVHCSGKRPFLVEQAYELTSTGRPELLLDAPNESIIVARSDLEWETLTDHDPSALGLTLLWFDKRNGEILDVDMELNAGTGHFADCAVTNCTTGMVDLQNTVTHEAGHLLGLGHSTAPNSTMEARTHTHGELHKRLLSADDRAGYCALSLPEPSCVGESCLCDAPRIIQPRKLEPLVGGCHMQSEPATGRSCWLHTLAAVCLLCWRRAATRRCRFARQRTAQLERSC